MNLERLTRMRLRQQMQLGRAGDELNIISRRRSVIEAKLRAERSKIEVTRQLLESTHRSFLPRRMTMQTRFIGACLQVLASSEARVDAFERELETVLKRQTFAISKYVRSSNALAVLDDRIARHAQRRRQALEILAADEYEDLAAAACRVT